MSSTGLLDNFYQPPPAANTDGATVLGWVVNTNCR